MHRTTEQSIDLTELPTTIAVIETTHPRKGTQRWQPLHVREKLTETDSPSWPTGEGWAYTVRVGGVLLRKDGSVGQMPIAMVFSAPAASWDSSGGIDDIPADIAELLVGADGLRDWKRAL